MRVLLLLVVLEIAARASRTIRLPPNTTAKNRSRWRAW